MTNTINHTTKGNPKFNVYFTKYPSPVQLRVAGYNAKAVEEFMRELDDAIMRLVLQKARQERHGVKVMFAHRFVNDSRPS